MSNRIKKSTNIDCYTSTRLVLCMKTRNVPYCDAQNLATLSIKTNVTLLRRAVAKKGLSPSVAPFYSVRYALPYTPILLSTQYTCTFQPQ